MNAKDSALIDAVEKEDISEVRALLEAGADPHATDGFYLSAVGLSVFARDAGIAKALLDAGADIYRSAGQPGHMTCLESARQNAWPEVRAIFEEKAKEEKECGENGL